MLSLSGNCLCEKMAAASELKLSEKKVSIMFTKL